MHFLSHCSEMLNFLFIFSFFKICCYVLFIKLINLNSQRSNFPVLHLNPISTKNLLFMNFHIFINYFPCIFLSSILSHSREHYFLMTTNTQLTCQKLIVIFVQYIFPIFVPSHLGGLFCNNIKIYIQKH